MITFKPETYVTFDTNGLRHVYRVQTYFFMLKYKQRAHLFGNFLEVGAIDMQCMRSEHNIKKLCHERPFLALKIK